MHKRILRTAIASASVFVLAAALGPRVLTGAKADVPPPKKVKVELNVVERNVKILGVDVKSWTYNGTVPGPTVRLNVGDTLEMVLTNTHNLPHAIHTHFMDYEMSSDGSSMTAPLPIVPHQEDDVKGTVGGVVPYVGGSSPGPHVGHNPIGPYEPREDSDVARSGQTYTYTYEMTDVGTFWYHCHVMEATDHISKGLFGFIIVYPKGWTYDELEPDALNGNTKAWVTKADGSKVFDDVVIISERNPATDSAVAAVAQGGVAGGPIYLANFRAWNDPYVVGPVKTGTDVLLHVGNIGESPHSWHVHGHHFYELWQTWHPDGFKPELTDKDPFTPISSNRHALALLSGEIFPTYFTAGKPGMWFMHDHVVPDAYLGMVPWLKVTP